MAERCILQNDTQRNKNLTHELITILYSAKIAMPLISKIVKFLEITIRVSMY